jgi:hypothetical protein
VLDIVTWILQYLCPSTPIFRKPGLNMQPNAAYMLFRTKHILIPTCASSMSRQHDTIWRISNMHYLIFPHALKQPATFMHGKKLSSIQQIWLWREKLQTPLCMPKPICPNHTKLLYRQSYYAYFGIKLNMTLSWGFFLVFIFCSALKKCPCFYIIYFLLLILKITIRIQQTEKIMFAIIYFTHSTSCKTWGEME